MSVRDIVHIDEEKCDGCGLCVPSCEEGAIRIVDGKAKVVSDIYCDGLGACLGHCPQGAISIVQREAGAFDEQAVAQHLAAQPDSSPAPACGTGCPGATALSWQSGRQAAPSHSPTRSEHGQGDGDQQPSQLANWPVQLHLVPPHAPFLHEADLLLVADCVPFACADFHARILNGRPVVIGCPKLDDCSSYAAKLAAVIEQSAIRSISVVHMEVPCCTGLVRVAQVAIQQAGSSIPLRQTVVTRQGNIIEGTTAQDGAPPATKSAASPRQLPVL